MEQFAATTLLASVFLLATLTTATLGYAAGSRVLVVIDAVGNATLFAGIGTAGVLAFGADIYPVDMRSTGIGWAMGAGRLAEVLLPLLIGTLMTINGGRDTVVFPVIAVMPLLGVLSILLLRWNQSRPDVAAHPSHGKGLHQEVGGVSR